MVKAHKIQTPASLMISKVFQEHHRERNFLKSLETFTNICALEKQKIYSRNRRRETFFHLIFTHLRDKLHDFEKTIPKSKYKNLAMMITSASRREKQESHNTTLYWK